VLILSGTVSVRAHAVSNDTAKKLDTYAQSSPVQRAMPYVHTFNEFIKLDGIYGFCSIRIQVVATIDAQNNYIITIDDYSVIPYGESVNFNSLYIRGLTCTPNENNRTIQVDFIAMLNTGYEIMGTTYGNTTEHPISHTFFLD